MALFLRGQEKRLHFRACLPVSLLGLGSLCSLCDLLPQPASGWGVYLNFLYTLIPFALSITVVTLCWHLSVPKAACLGIIAFSVQYTAFTINHFWIQKVPMPEMAVMAVDYAVFFAVLAVYGYSFGRNVIIDEVISVKNKKVISLCCATLLFCYAGELLIGKGQSPLDVWAYLVARIFPLLCAFLALALVFDAFREDALAREKREVELLLKREEHLHQISKEQIELINIRCHDLKHRVDLARANRCLSEEELRDMENTISIYDGFLKTGNEDLDIVIAEKSICCGETGIALTCMVDGKVMDFMAPGDIYSLFGNALDNAIEYLAGIEDKNKRLINLSIRRNGSFVGIRIENYCESEVRFLNGLPVTTKADKSSHGFGTKSMQHIVQKYRGSLCCEVEHNTFVVNIIFPAGLS